MTMLTHLPLKPTPRMLRQFAAAWLIFFLLLAFKFGLRQHSTAGVILTLVSLAGVIGLLTPRVLHWPFVVLTIAAFPIGWVMTQLVLALLFYCVLFPFALIFRLRGRDALRLRKRNAATFWVERGEQPPPEKYLKQF